jgi:RNA polymerase primary sigma factor
MTTDDSENLDAPEEIEFGVLQEQIRKALPYLTIREAGVIESRFGLRDGKLLTLVEIGKLHGVSIDRIREIEEKLMELLVHPSRSQTLHEYLD